MLNSIQSITIALCVVIAFSFSSLANDWIESGRDPVIHQSLDGKIITIRNEQSGGFLRQGYRASRDDKRNVEADTGHLMAPRGEGYDWVLRPAGGDYWFIVNLKTGLFLTKDGGDDNVSNWGKIGSGTNDMKWRFEYSTHPPGVRLDTIPNDGTPIYGRKMRIYNKGGDGVLTYSGGNVGIWEKANVGSSYGTWRVRASEATPFELQLRKFSGDPSTSTNSSSLHGLFKLTITSLKAIKTSTGQDGATKVLFAGIDLAIDIGMGIASGGASAAGKAAGKAALKGGARAVSRDAVVSAARAAMRHKLRQAPADFAKGAGKAGIKQLIGDPKGELQKYARGQLESGTANTSLSGPTQALLAANDIMNALSSEAIFNKVYPSSPDSVDIYVNGTSIWPNGGRSEGRSMKSQQTRPVNKEFIFEAGVGFNIQLYEYDYASDDDYMGQVDWYPWQKVKPYLDMIRSNKRQEFNNILISNDHEGSLYEISYYVEPLVPEILSEGKLRQKWVRPRIIERGCTSGSASDCLEHAKILSNYVNWEKTPKYRDVAIDIFELACNIDKNPYGCSELRSAVKPACEAGHKKSCRIHKANVARYNMVVWRLNCENGEGTIAQCLKLADALNADARAPSKEWDEALGLYDTLCDQSYSNSCDSLRVLSTKMCEAGVGYGCDRRGNMFWSANGETQNFATAEEWMIKGCNLEEEFACLNAAVLVRKRALKAVDMDRIDGFKNAIEVAQTGCDLGLQDACDRAKNYESDMNDEKQRPYFRCSENHGPSCNIYGNAFLAAGLKSKARDAFSTGCRSKTSPDAEACLGTGLLEVYDGVNKSWGGHYFELGCDLNNARSCFEAGKYFADPDYNPYNGPDLQKARLSWTKACDLGHQDSCTKKADATIFGGTLIERSSCSVRRKIQSTSGYGAKLTITNSGPETVYMFWMDENGAAVNYKRESGKPEATIEPSSTIEKHTRIGNAWLFTDIQGKCYGTLIVEDDPAQQRTTTLLKYTIDSSGGTYEDNLAQQTSQNSGQNSGQSSSANVGQQQSGNTNSSQNSSSNTATNNSSGVQQLDSCGQIGQLVSTSNGQQIELTMQNTSAGTMRVFWVDQSGNEGDFNGGQDPVFIVDAGDTLSQMVEIGDVYSVYDDNSACIGVVPTLAAKATYELASNSGSGQSANAGKPQTGNTSSSQTSSSGNASSFKQLDSCGQLGQLVSTSNGQQITLTMQNPNSDPKRIFWIDQSGNEGDFNGGGDPVFTLSAGETRDETAEVGDVYSVYDSNSNCMGVIPTLSASASYSLTAGNGQNTNSSNQVSSTSSQANTSVGSQILQSHGSGAQVVLQSGDGCDLWGQTQSQNITDGAEVSFTNNGTKDLYVFWIDENGDSKNYSRQDDPLVALAPGETKAFTASIGYHYSGLTIINGAWKCEGILRLTEMNTDAHFTNPNSNFNASQSSSSSGNQTQQSSGSPTQIVLEPGDGCDLFLDTKSQRITDGAQVSFTNDGAEDIYVFWIDENGDSDDYQRSGQPLAELAPGDTQSFPGSIGYHFSALTIYNGSWKCEGMLRLSTMNTEVYFSSSDRGSNSNISQNSVSTNNQQNSAANNSGNTQQQQTTQNTSQNQAELHSGTGCALRDGSMQSNFGTDANVTFNNYGSEPVFVYWVNEGGEESDYSGNDEPLLEIEPGNTETINSNIGFIYSALALSGDDVICIGATQITTASNTYNLYSDYGGTPVYYDDYSQEDNTSFNNQD